MSTVDLIALRKSYGTSEILHGIDLAVAQGEFLALVGPSGCGKSTMLRMIAGLETVSSGEIRFDGRSVNTVDPKRRNVAMVFQNYALYPHMTVRENMGLNLRISGLGRAGGPPSRRGGCRPARGDADPRPAAVAAFGRSTTARGDGPGDRARSGGLSLRRAALQSRRQAPGADARRDQVAAPEGAYDRDLRHARPDRGDDAGRPDRGDEFRADRAARHAARALPQSGEPLCRGLHRVAGDELPARPDRRRAAAHRRIPTWRWTSATGPVCRKADGSRSASVPSICARRRPDFRAAFCRSSRPDRKPMFSSSVPGDTWWRCWRAWCRSRPTSR